MALRLVRTAACACETAGRVRLARARDCFAPADRARLLRGMALDILDVYGIALEVEGPLPQPGSFLASNHLSWMDPLAILAAAPCIPAAKAEVARWPLVGTIAKRSGVEFVDRRDALSGARLVRATARLLEEGASVLTFPEGTTSDGAGTLPFKPAAFRAARLASAPVVPVSVSYDWPGMAWTGDATFVPHFLKLLARRGCTATVRFGAALEASSGEQHVSQRTRAAIDRCLEEGRRVPAIRARVHP